MVDRNDMLERLDGGGLEASFQLGERRYRCFAHRSRGRGGAYVCWRLYAEDDRPGQRVRGLTFGVARGLEEALADLFQAAEEHSRRGVVTAHGGTLRPSPRD